MRQYIIYNKSTKHIVEKEFSDFEKAEQYRKKSLSSSYTVKQSPFDDSNEFRSMLRKGFHYQFMYDIQGVCGIMRNGYLLHCGYISIITIYILKTQNINVKEISKIDFINLHNELLESYLN
jgi:hypothetical protein